VAHGQAAPVEHPQLSPTLKYTSNGGSG
jgi:hypothetical protein